MWNDVPATTGAGVEVSATLVRAAADVVLPLLPALREATPLADALQLGRRGLGDPFAPTPTGPPTSSGLPDALPDLLHPVLAGLPLAPPAALLAHPVLIGLDRDAVDQVVAEQREYRRRRDAGESFTAHWERAAVSDQFPGRVAAAPPDPLDGIRELIGTLTELLGHDAAVTRIVAGNTGPDGREGMGGGGGDSEPAVAARRGATLAGVGVGVAALVQRAIPGLATDPDLAGLLGWVGYARAVALLDRLPAPPAYDAAVLADHRRSFTLPRTATADLHPYDCVLTLIEGFRAAYRAGGAALAALLPAGDPDFSRNGLVTITDGVLQIRTREPSGHCQVTVTAQATDPGQVDTTSWDEVVDTTWTASEGLGVLVSDPISPWGAVPVYTPPWPGTYRVRVHAARPATHHGEPGPERYLIVAWPAPPAPATTHKLSDDLGRRLRGEPAPRRREGPLDTEWISYNDPHAITVITTGATDADRVVDDVVAILGGDPAAPISGPRIYHPDLYSQLVIAYTASSPTQDAVLIIEPNGYRALSLLDALSAGGRRAATYFWNVNAVTRLALAEDGQLLAHFEPGLEPPPPDSPVADLWADLDFADPDSDRSTDNALAVIERFTGFRWQYDDVYAPDTERAWIAPPP